MRSRRLVGVLVLLVGAAGCPDDDVVPADGGSESSGAGLGSTTRDDADASGTTDAIGTTSTSGSTTASADDDASTGSTGVLFLPPPGDVGDSTFQCDIFAQDCPAGEKCTPYGEGPFADSWIGWRCTPLVDDPVPAGETCQVQGEPSSGIDDCERGAFCYGVDPKTLQGTCHNLCVGSTSDFICEDPGELCIIETGGPVVVCMPVCDPRVVDCLAGEVCIPFHDIWICGPDGSGDGGAYGDPCQFSLECDPGLFCLDSSAMPPGLPCEAELGCCTEICDLDDPAGDAQCTGAAGGQMCVPWYDPGKAPPGYEDVGVCAILP